MTRDFHDIQQAICRKYQTDFAPVSGDQMVGLSDLAVDGNFPLHGLRHPPIENSCGWYIWAGEWSYTASFFKPFHAEHMMDICRSTMPYLALPPGWRFLIAQGYEDVWYDASLLNLE